jgi:hypothetical protein
MVAATATASARAETVIASATVWPDARPPTARTTTQAMLEITPPASSAQPAPAAPAPNRVKRRNRYAAARPGPASGMETDIAFAA